MNFCKGGMKNIGSEEHILDNMLWDLLTLEALTNLSRDPPSLLPLIPSWNCKRDLHLMRGLLWAST